MKEIPFAIRETYCFAGEQIVLTLLQVFSLRPVSIEDG